MFNSHSDSKYSKEKVRLFLKYLANAAKKLEKKQPIEEIKNIPKEIQTYKFKEKQETIEKKVQERLKEITPEKKEELELKIKTYFSRNKFLPYETKIKKIKSIIKKLEKTDKRKAKSLLKKINSIEKLLRSLKKIEILESKQELKEF
ncbi:MAG: hypothetical protein QXR96_02960 [Candidatus Woesearchaeota archaeon]